MQIFGIPIKSGGHTSQLHILKLSSFSFLMAGLTPPTMLYGEFWSQNRKMMTRTVSAVRLLRYKLQWRFYK